MMNMNAFLDNLRTLIDEAQKRIQRTMVSDRDRKAVIFGGLGFLILVLYMVFQFFSSGSARLEKKAQSLQADLKRFESLRAEYLGSKHRIEELANTIKTGDEPLISVVEKTLVDSRIDRGNFSIRSRTSTSGDLYEETSVDVEIKKIPLDRMVDVLYKFQTMPAYLKVSKLRPQTRFDNPDLMDISFRVSTFKLNQVL
jgi:type II secretory pathway component PulM